MSDQVEQAEAYTPPDPTVTLVHAPTGGLFGIVHLGEKVRAFFGHDEARVRALVSKVGVAEFSLPQDRADALAETGISGHHDKEQAEEDAGDQFASLQADNERLASEHADLSKAHEELQSTLDGVQAKHDALAQQLADVGGKLEAAEAECQRLEAERARLSEQLQPDGGQPQGAQPQGAQPQGDPGETDPQAKSSEHEGDEDRHQEDKAEDHSKGSDSGPGAAPGPAKEA